MTDLTDLGFDANQEEEPMSFDALPAGKYPAIATEFEKKATKAGNGYYLECIFTILDNSVSNTKGRKVWHRFNLWNPSSQAADIARRQFAALCRAVDIPSPKQAEELLNKPLTIGVKYVNPTQQNPNASNEVNAWLKIDGKPAKPQQSQQSAQAHSGYQPAQSAPNPGATPDQGSGGSIPWRS